MIQGEPPAFYLSIYFFETQSAPLTALRHHCPGLPVGISVRSVRRGTPAEPHRGVEAGPQATRCGRRMYTTIALRSGYGRGTLSLVIHHDYAVGWKAGLTPRQLTKWDDGAGRHAEDKPSQMPSG